MCIEAVAHTLVGAVDMILVLLVDNCRKIIWMS